MAVRGRFSHAPDRGALEPTRLGNLWGVGLLARNSDNLGDPNTRYVGASHQVRNLGGSPAAPNDTSTGVQIALGVGNGDQPNPTIVDGLTPPPIAYPGIGAATYTPDPTAPNLSFTLQTGMDLDLGIGWSRLFTPGKSWPEILWKFPSTFAPSTVTAVGFTLSVPNLPPAYSRGTPVAWIDDFSIYEGSPWPWLQLFRFLSKISEPSGGR